MSLQKTLERVRREALKDPKKAGVLGVLALVAVYFWAPLVVGWLPKGQSSDELKPAAPAPPTAFLPAAPATPSGDVEKKETVAPVNWQQLAQARKRDPQTQPVDLSAARDPFRPVEKKVAVVEEKPQEKPKPVKTLSLEKAGVVLSSTLVGSHGGLARINGKTYRPGQQVTVNYDGNRITLWLSEVHARRVVLELDGKRYELKAPELRSGEGSQETPAQESPATEASNDP